MLGTKVEDQGFLVSLGKIITGRQRLMAVRVCGGVWFHFRGSEGMLLAQWMPLPVVRHQDTSQIGVTAEPEAVHVVRLAFVPIGVGKHRGYAGPVSYTHLRAHETDSYLVCR